MSRLHSGRSASPLGASALGSGSGRAGGAWSQVTQMSDTASASLYFIFLSTPRRTRHHAACCEPCCGTPSQLCQGCVAHTPPTRRPSVVLAPLCFSHSNTVVIEVLLLVSSHSPSPPPPPPPPPIHSQRHSPSLPLPMHRLAAKAKARSPR